MRRFGPVVLVLTLSLATAGHSVRAAGSREGTRDPPVFQAETRSAAEAWPIALACAEAPSPDTRGNEEAWEKFSEQMARCETAVRDVVSRGDDTDRERLWSTFDGLAAEAALRTHVLDAFLDWHAARAMEDLARATGPASGKPSASSHAALPESLRDAPAELQEAWRVYNAVTGGAEGNRSRPAAEDRVTFQDHEPAFQGVVSSFLRGRASAAETVREVSRFEWAGWCGVGSEALGDPQSKALLIAFLRMGRPDLAITATRGLSQPSFGTEPGAEQWDRRLLAAAGVDWESFYVGAIVDGQTGLADTLARQGSDGAARELVLAARWLANGDRAEGEESRGLVEDLVWPLGALVESPGACGYASSDSREVERDPGAPGVSEEVQQEVLELLAERIGPEAGLDEADSASHLLVQRCRPESREAFRTMLRSPYSEVRRRGAAGLRGLGETVPEPRASRPVRLRVLVDGKSMPQTIEWALLSEQSGYLSSTAATDGDGVLHLDRDPFVDPRRVITSVQLTAPKLLSPSQVWFAVSVSRPADLDIVTTVSVRTGALVVLVPEGLVVSEDGRRSTLRLVADAATDGPPLLSEELAVPAARIVFPRLQHGLYTAVLHCPDGSIHVSPQFEVGERPALVRVSEQPVPVEGGLELQ